MRNSTLAVATLGLALLPVGWQAPGAALAPAQAATAPTRPAHADAWPLAQVPDQAYGDRIYVYDTTDPAAQADPALTIGAGPSSVCTAQQGTGGTWVTMVGVGSCTLTARPDPSAPGPATPATHTFWVGRARLEVRIDDKEKASGDPNPDFTATYAGLRNGDSPGDVRLTLSGPPRESRPGRYHIVPRSRLDDHYYFVVRGGVLTIDPMLDMSVTGLPPGSPVIGVEVDGKIYSPPFRVPVAFGKPHQIYWWPIIHLRGVMFVTDLGAETIDGTQDLTQTATYDSIVGNFWPTAWHRDLIAEFQDVELALGTDQALPMIEEFAQLVRAERPMLFPWEQDQAIADLDILYHQYGGAGDL